MHEQEKVQILIWTTHQLEITSPTHTLTLRLELSYIDVKELQAMLNDDSLSFKERQYVKDAMRRFQRQENRGLVEKADVVGKKSCATNSTSEI